MKKFLVVMAICAICFCDIAFAMETGSAANGNGGKAGISSQQTANQDTVSQKQTQSQKEGSTTPDNAQGNSSQNATNESKARRNGQSGDSEAPAQASAQPQSETQTQPQNQSQNQLQSETQEQPQASLTASGDGELKTDMPEGELLFITLAQDTSYRWNANGSGKNSVIHLDTASGANCNFRLKHTEGEWYGIKHIKSGGIDRYADIDHAKTDSGANLLLWESSDNEISGSDHEHRQFAFYYAGSDSHGNDRYYIKNRNSGKWMAYEDSDGNGKPGYGDKIIQADKDKRALWIITKEVVPKQGGEATDLVKGGEKYVFCEMFQAKTIKTVNRKGDMAANGTAIHFYEMGTSSKWRLEYNSKYEAYEIHAVTDGEADRNNKVWDVEDESGAEGKQIQLWSCQSKDRNENTSQLWRFFRQGNGSYKIQNARSGKYVAYNASGEWLKQSATGIDIDVGLIAGSRTTVNFDYAKTWMQDVPDGALLSSVNLPGSHDAGTAAIVEDFLAELSFTSCQKLYYGEQLNAGVRSFDIRCNAKKDKAKASDVMIIHGGALWQCFDRDGGDLTLDDILSDSVRFLQSHPTESLVILLSPDDGSAEGLCRAVGTFIKDNQNYVWTGSGTPSMGEARGRIVFMRRYQIDTNKYDPASDGLNMDCFGIDLSGWGKYSYSNCQYYAPKIYDKNGVTVYAQDAYKESSGNKWKFITGTMAQTTGTDRNHTVPDDAWVYNYTSCTGQFSTGVPLELTRDINPKLFYDAPKDYINNQSLGMVMMNFVDHPMAKLIYETNTAKGRTFAPKADFPDSIRITYGQKLWEGQLAGGSMDGSWRFEDANYIPTYADFKNKKTFKLTYTPNDKRLLPVTKDVCITEFHKKEIPVKIDDKEITYGEAKPELTYSFDESLLVGNDTADDLGIHLELTPDPEKPLAGVYAIKGDYHSDNYAVTFTGGSLKVNQKQVSVKWSDTKNLVYTGSPMNVTAGLLGLLDGDDCEAVVEGGNETGPSWDGDTGKTPTKYTATVTKLAGADYKNYQLPDETSIDYYIRRANADDFAFPEKAYLTYGQKLSEATLSGACGDGEFIFIKDGANAGDDMPDAGTYEYNMAYRPKDTQTEHAMTGTVTVVVSKKAVIAKANAKEKTYGDTTPALTYSFDESQLAEGDTKDSLALALTAGTGDDQYCNAGTYQIAKASCTSSNYDVSVIPADLAVLPRTAKIAWPGQTKYTYSGSAVNITPTVANCAREGECSVAVLGGTGISAGRYKAAAIALDNRNYRLPADKTQLIFDYEITKADPAVTFPSSATVTYGDTLSQAVLSGQSGEGSFHFENGGEILNVSDSGQARTMIFTPTDKTNYNSVKQEIPVTVNQKPLTITIDDKQKTYGQETPGLTWHMDEAQLIGSDNTGEFQFTLTAGNGDKPDCDAGVYEITSRIVKQNDNYALGFQNGTLQVEPLEAAFRWNIQPSLTVGDPAPSADIVNLVKADDDCKPVVESDGTDTPSWTAGSDEIKIFNAEITGLTGKDKFNYTLPDVSNIPDNEDPLKNPLHRQYLVRRADANDYNMPKTAVMTYGQTLAEAELILAAGDGTFSFVSADFSNQDISGLMPSGAGIFKYHVKFTPADNKEKPAWAEIPVLVKQKKITAYAENEEKTYGERTKLSFTLDESQLVGKDSQEGLKLSLTAVNADDTEKPDGDQVKSPAGAYRIEKKSCGNSSYDVTVVPAALWIHQKEIKLAWPDVSTLYYTGEPVNVTAQAAGLVAGDACDVTVVNGNRIEPGTYRAAAVSLSNKNYILPRDLSQLMKEYTIQKPGGGPGADGNGNGGTGSDPGNGSPGKGGHGMKTADSMSLVQIIALCMLVLSSGTAVMMLLRRKR